MAEEKEILEFDPNHSAIPINERANVATVSDLHIGVAHRQSIGGKGWVSDEEIIAGLKCIIKKIGNNRERSHLVLNGDIFEMVYSAEPSSGKPDNETSAEHHNLRDIQRKKYIETLEDIITTAKENNCTIHYVGGNHDDNVKFVKLLRQLEKECNEGCTKGQEIFLFHPVALRLGSVLFTHGDLPLRSKEHNDIRAGSRMLGRESFMVAKSFENELGENATPNPFDRGIQGAECRMNGALHGAVEKLWNSINPNQKRAAKIFDSLNKSGMLDEIECDGKTLPAISRICTGHTHDGYVLLNIPGNLISGNVDREKARKILFDNTGSGLSEDRLNAIQYLLDKDKVLKTEKIEEYEITGRKKPVINIPLPVSYSISIDENAVGSKAMVGIG